ncbi:MAG: hypothetical protein JNL69_01630 [Bacteroidia bacterium]|nr:hypothetical protein [Bacteroidia bacterium]
MEIKMNFIAPLFERAEEYGKTSYELFKLKAIDKIAEMVSTIVSRVYFMIALAMFATTLNIGISIWLGEMLGKVYYGFFCVAGFYSIIGIVLFFFLHRPIKNKVSNRIISQMIN